MTTYIQNCPNCSTFTNKPHKRDCVNFHGILKGSELRLGDVVRLSDSPYSYATVKNLYTVDNKYHMVTFFRPYVHTADFSCTSGVICYIGIEEFSTYASNTSEYEVVSRTNLK